MGHRHQHRPQHGQPQGLDPHRPVPPHTYTFLAGHHSVRVHTGIGRDTARDVYQDRRDYVWNNNGDTATLRDNHQHIIAAKSWGCR